MSVIEILSSLGLLNCKARVLNEREKEYANHLKDVMQECIGLLNTGVISFLNLEPDSYHMAMRVGVTHMLKHFGKQKPLTTVFPEEPHADNVIRWAERGVDAVRRDDLHSLLDSTGEFLSSFAILLGPTMCDRPYEVGQVTRQMEALRFKRLKVLPEAKTFNQMYRME